MAEAEHHSDRPSSRPGNARPTIKIGMVGDTQTGKTALREVYMDGQFDVDFRETLAVNFTEKTEKAHGQDINLSVWDFGGQMSDLEQLEQVCQDAHAVLFVFDLCRPATLASVREWHRRVRAINLKALPVLVGTKYDAFVSGQRYEMQQRVVAQASQAAKVLEAPLLFSSAPAGINISKVFALVVCHFVGSAPLFGMVPTAVRNTMKDGALVHLPMLDYTQLAARHNWQVVDEALPSQQASGVAGAASEAAPRERRKRRPIRSSRRTSVPSGTYTLSRRGSVPSELEGSAVLAAEDETGFKTAEEIELDPI